MTRISSEALILGITPEGDRLKLWMWSQTASLQILGTFSPQPAVAIVARLMRGRPDLQVFIATKHAIGAEAVPVGLVRSLLRNEMERLLTADVARAAELEERSVQKSLAQPTDIMRSAQ